MPSSREPAQASLWGSGGRRTLRIASNPHDFGTYYSVVIDFGPNDADAVAYAYRCDAESPDQWDMAARLELEAARKGEREGSAA